MRDEDDLEPEGPESAEEAVDDAEPRRDSRIFRFARRLMDRKELAEDTKDLLVAVLATSDKAKSEAVRMAARELRNYLDELKLKEDFLRILTSYSLEISVHLKPLASLVEPGSEAEEGAPEGPNR